MSVQSTKHHDSFGSPEELWSDDPAQKVIQLSRQLKLARGKLEKKSDFCDELAEELRRLERKLEEKDGELRESRSLFSAAGTELRTAAYESAVERSQSEAEIAAFRRRVKAFQDSAQAVHGHHEHTLQQLEECRRQAQSGEAESEALARVANAARLRSSLASEEALMLQVESSRHLAETASQEVASLRAHEDCCRAELEASDRSHDALAAALRSEAETLRENMVTIRHCNAELKASRDECARLESAAPEHAAPGGEPRRPAARRSVEGPSAAGVHAAEPCREPPVGMEGQVATLRREAAEARGREAAAMGRIETLETMLRNERELHDEAIHLFEASRTELHDQEHDLQKELEHLSHDTEEKEADMMNIQFAMVELQNRLQDQAKLITDNQREIEQGRSKMEEKDEKLQHALRRQQELVVQMNEATGKLQEKVAQLSRDLDSSRTAYQALEQQSRAVIDRLELDRGTCKSELERIRSEADQEVAALRERLEQQETTMADFRSVLERKLSEVEADAEATASKLEASLEREDELSLQLTLRAAAAEGTATELAELQASLDKRDAHCRKASADYDAKESEIVSLRVALETMEIQDHARQQQLGEARKDAKQREEECLHLRELVALRDAELQNARAELDIRKEQQMSEVAAHQVLRETTRLEAQRSRDLQEELLVTSDHLRNADSRIQDLCAALDRSRLLERQAIERAQEYRTRLNLFREFGHEDFMQDTREDVSPRHGTGARECRLESLDVSNNTAVEEDLDDRLGAAVPSVLLAVELDLGFTVATLTVAPWHTRADFDAIVRDFLREQRVKPVFADAVVRYLVEVEEQAVAFPTTVQADLTDVYTRYG